MPTYRCPECEAVLRREQPVPAGKKIKCPKCEFVFAPKAVAEKAQKAAPAAKGKPAAKDPPKPSALPAVVNDDEDDEEKSYAVVQEEEQERAVHYGSLRDKFKKSKRGPAMAQCVVPSNFTLYEGFLACIGTLICFIVGFWPMIFSDDPVTLKERLPYILAGLFGFALSCFICYCASRFHELTSYPLAWIGVVLATILSLTGIAIPVYILSQKIDPQYIDYILYGLWILFAAFWTYGGIRGMRALKSPLVREGFAEVAEDKEGKLLG